MADKISRKRKKRSGVSTGKAENSKKQIKNTVNLYLTHLAQDLN